MNQTVRLHILFVDEEEDPRSIRLRRQALRDYNLLLAADWEEAIQILQESPEPFDCIVSSFGVRMDGLEFLRKVKDDVRFLHIPFILTNVPSSKEIVKTARRRGAHACIARSRSLDELRHSIRVATRDVARDETNLSA